jgi:hypothetical protein
MSKNKRKLHLLASLITLFLLAFGVGCKGFFVNSPLSSISVNFTNGSSVIVGGTTTVRAFGVTNDGQGSFLTNNVSWSNCIDTDGTTVDGTVTGSGSATFMGQLVGTCTITASSQSVSGSGTATVVLTGVTSIIVNPSSNNVVIDGSPVYFTAMSGATDITSSATWHIVDSSNANQDANFTIGFLVGSGKSFTPLSTAAPGQYTIDVTYPGSIALGTAKLTVTTQ